MRALACVRVCAWGGGGWGVLVPLPICSSACANVCVSVVGRGEGCMHVSYISTQIKTYITKKQLEFFSLSTMLLQ